MKTFKLAELKNLNPENFVIRRDKLNATTLTSKFEEASRICKFEVFLRSFVFELKLFEQSVEQSVEQLVELPALRLINTGQYGDLVD